MENKTKQHLQFIYNRMKNVHEENESYDYMIEFRNIIDNNIFLNMESDIKSEIFLALSMRLGFIETGTPHRAKDLVKTGELKPKALTIEQMKLIIKLEEVMKLILT